MSGSRTLANFRTPCRPGRKWLALGLVLVLPDCATQQVRIQEVNNFATAGVHFTEAVPEALNASFAKTIEFDSQKLLESREPLSEQDRKEELNLNTEVLLARAKILDDIKQHVALLRQYFILLKGLSTTGDQDSGLVELAGGITEKLQALSPSLAEASIGGKSLSESVGPAVSFALASYRSNALDQELARRGTVIEAEIRLLRAALSALAESMQEDLEVQRTEEYRDAVIIPYMGEGPLPSSWIADRRRLLTTRNAITPLDAAVEAADTLRANFVALLERRLNASDISLLVEDVGDILAHLDKDVAGS